MLIIAGAKDWAYHNESLIELDQLTDDTKIMYNYHMYMHPDSQKNHKNIDALEAYVENIQEATDKPVIFTEFGQWCCDTNGVCGVYQGQWQDQSMGYAEAVINVAHSHGVSWTTWAWRPGAANSVN